MDQERAPMRRYERCGPVRVFPPLPAAAKTTDAGQWAAMMRAMARLETFPADNADILAFEAQTYITARQTLCDHAWVTVNDHRRPVYRECIRCDRHRR